MSFVNGEGGNVELCEKCHDPMDNIHPVDVDPALSVPPVVPPLLPLGTRGVGKGRVVCSTCHFIHARTAGLKLLRGFPERSGPAESLRAPPRGSPGAQRFAEIPLREEDPNRLCNRCHESGLSKANAHPIRVVPDAMRERMPADWPLFEGSLTCITCHTAGDSPIFDPANPSFLRGGPYESRNDICWRCHDREDLSRLNPHLDVQGGRGCELCHDTKPDRSKPLEVKKLMFKGDIVVLCLRCHEYQEHPAARAGRRSAAAFLVLCVLSCVLPSGAGGEVITRRHLDAGRVEFSGMDLKGDQLPDAVTQDNIKKTVAYFLVDERRRLTRIDPLSLPEEERRFLPDVLVERDLDGDEVLDLLLCNREYLLKFADNEAVFTRILGGGIFIGRIKGTYQDLDGCHLSPEARTAVVGRAREIALQEDR